LGVGVREPGVGFVGPLHLGPARVPARQREVVAHADLVAVHQQGRPREREQQAVGEFESVAVGLREQDGVVASALDEVAHP
jgi:hypothetical protein